jgi:serine/threonine protein kinase
MVSLIRDLTEVTTSLFNSLSVVILDSQGLYFIHQSPVLCHGNLSSSTCLIDSHWTLKLTDFGPKKLIDRAEPKEEGIY